MVRFLLSSVSEFIKDAYLSILAISWRTIFKVSVSFYPFLNLSLKNYKVLWYTLILLFSLAIVSVSYFSTEGL